MTDKQIIIDGVPVQDCCYFDYENDGYEDSCYMYDNECSANCNCYYKQLKAKEQELQEAMDNYVKLDNQRVKEYNELVDRYTVKEQECETLASQLDFEVQKKECLEHELEVAEVKNIAYEATVKDMRDHIKFIDETNRILYDEKVDLLEQIDQLKAENRELKAVHSTNVALSDELFKYKAENDKLKVYKSMAPLKVKKLVQTLTEIKSILELYANSKVGEEQPDGTYQLSSGIGGSFGFGFGVCTTTYDPRPARQALQKISEVIDET